MPPRSTRRPDWDSVTWSNARSPRCRVGSCSRAYLARAVGSLATGRRLLLADEPTSALDFAGQDDVAQLLADLAVDRLVVSHDTAVVRRADRVLEMAGGSLRERAA